MDASHHEEELRVSVELTERIRRGDRSAEDELVRRYGRGLLYLLERRTRDRELALDLRQDVLRLAIEKLRRGELEDAAALAPYLRAIAVNLFIGHIRKETRRATTPDTDAIEIAVDHSQGPFENVAGEQARAAVRALLEELPVARDREILLRFYLDDEDKEPICASLGIDSAHFNRVLFRAKQRFRELLLRADRKGKLRLVG